jgi:chromosome partitioning protein
MPKSIVFHSYKGGTGKTTLAANYAVLLARKGFRVFLLDLDVYAPSLQIYFEMEPDKWINDFLTGDTELNDVMVDLTSVVAENSDINNSSSALASSNGKLWLGFSNPKKEEIYKLEGGKQEKVQFLRRFIVMREKLFSDFKADYVIIDTSPGIRYWSINALAIADILFLTLKSGDLDIAGTKKMVGEIYSSFTKFGAKPYLILNKVAGYCVPNSLVQAIEHSTTGSMSGTLSSSTIVVQQEQEKESSIDALSRETGISVISAMPCYCDIQFSKKEYLTVLRYPQHLFSKKIESLAQESQIQV